MYGRARAMGTTGSDRTAILCAITYRTALRLPQQRRLPTMPTESRICAKKGEFQL